MCFTVVEMFKSSLPSKHTQPLDGKIPFSDSWVCLQPTLHGSYTAFSVLSRPLSVYSRAESWQSSQASRTLRHYGFRECFVRLCARLCRSREGMTSRLECSQDQTVNHRASALLPLTHPARPGEDASGLIPTPFRYTPLLCGSRIGWTDRVIACCWEEWGPVLSLDFPLQYARLRAGNWIATEMLFVLVGFPINHTRHAFYHLYSLKCFWRLMLFEKCVSAGAWPREKLEGWTFQTCNCYDGIITEGRVFNVQLNHWITSTHPSHFSP